MRRNHLADCARLHVAVLNRARQKECFDLDPYPTSFLLPCETTAVGG
jgi:hypothetical protein